MQSTAHSSTKDSTVFVRTRTFLNSQKCNQGSSNWKIDYNRGLKTYADIAKSKSSQVYSNGSITKVNNVAQSVNMSVNTKNTQCCVYSFKAKQGVNSAQGDSLYDFNTDNTLYVLLVSGDYQNVKTCKQNSLAVKKEHLQKSSSCAIESNLITGSRTPSVNKGKSSVNSGDLDFATFNKFSVLNNDKSDEVLFMTVVRLPVQ